MEGVVPADPWSLVTGSALPEQRLAAPVPMAPVTCSSPAEASPLILARAGASHSRDSVDAAIVEGVRNRTGKQIDSQRDVGGWPMLATAPAPKDSDGDGMPDDWERAHGLNPNRDDSAADRNGNGYTNIEEYLNALASGQ